MFYKNIPVDNLEDFATELLPLVMSEFAELQNTTYFLTSNDASKYLETPALNNLLTRLNLLDKVVKVNVNSCYHYQTNVHRDIGEFNYSLNIPLSNCSNSALRFYAPHEGVPKEGHMMEYTSPNGLSFYLYEFSDDEVDQIAEYDRNCVYFVEADTPHRFESFSNEPSISIVLRISDTITSEHIGKMT